MWHTCSMIMCTVLHSMWVGLPSNDPHMSSGGNCYYLLDFSRVHSFVSNIFVKSLGFYSVRGDINTDSEDWWLAELLYLTASVKPRPFLSLIQCPLHRHYSCFSSRTTMFYLTGSQTCWDFHFLGSLMQVWGKFQRRIWKSECTYTIQ